MERQGIDHPTPWPRITVGGGRMRGLRAFDAASRFVDDMYALEPLQADIAPGFFFACMLYQGARASLSRTRSVALRFVHDGSRAERSSDMAMVVLLTNGSAQCMTHRGSSRIGAGDILILDLARSFTVDVEGPYSNLVLLTHRDQLAGLLRDTAAHGLVLSAGEPAAGLIGSQMRGLFDHAAGLDIRAAEVAMRGVASLTSILAEAAIQRQPAAGSDGGRRERALAYIDARLSDPDLTPQRLADHLGLSRSTAYRLFHAESGLRGLIIRRRLDRSRDALLAPENRGRPLREIAYAVGFQSEAHFSRAFRARFGMPPRRFTEVVDRQGPDWAALQAQRAGLLLPDETAHEAAKRTRKKSALPDLR